LLSQVTITAIRYKHLAMVKYLNDLWMPGPYEWKSLAFSAGVSCDQGIVDYVISQGGNNYTELIRGSIAGHRLDFVMRYMDKPGLDYNSIFGQAIHSGYLELAKLVAGDRRIDRSVLDDLMKRVTKRATRETIDYIISLGGNNYHDLVVRLAIYDQIELFKRYYTGPGVDYVEVLKEAMESSSFEVVKFMLEQQVVPTTEEELNSYLRLIRLDLPLIDLLFSLGATDYRYIVVRGVILGDLKVVAKYFDQAANLQLNSVFKQCTSVSVYQYLMSQGQVTQKTVDATLARLEQSKYPHVKAKQYLHSLSLQDGGSSQ
jgi:hypothetical protein